MIKQNDNSFPVFIGTIIKVAFNYIRYSQMVWMIIFWSMFLFVFFLSMIFVVIYSRPDLLTNALNIIIRILNIHDLHINNILVLGKEEILWAYGIISLVVYAIASLVQLIFNIKFTLNFKQKILFLLVIISGMSILMVIFISLAYFFYRDNIYLEFYIMVPFFAIGTLGTSVYYMLVSQIINFINKVIDYKVNLKITPK